MAPVHFLRTSAPCVRPEPPFTCSSLITDSRTPPASYVCEWQHEYSWNIPSTLDSMHGQPTLLCSINCSECMCACADNQTDHTAGMWVGAPTNGPIPETVGIPGNPPSGPSAAVFPPAKQPCSVVPHARRAASAPRWLPYMSI